MKTGDGGTVGSIVIDESLPGIDVVSLLVVDVVSEDSSVDVSSSVRAFSVVSVVVSDGGGEGEVGGDGDVGGEGSK